MQVFFGVPLPHLGVEALIAMANKLLMHYGCKTVTGRFMQTSHSLLFVELGLSLQPLKEQYEKFGYLFTHSWMKMLWEKRPMFNMHVIVADQPKEFPIMHVLINAGYTNEALGQLNIVHVSRDRKKLGQLSELLRVGLFLPTLDQLYFFKLHFINFNFQSYVLCKISNFQLSQLFKFDQTELQLF
jgi:hypothetical protein